MYLYIVRWVLHQDLTLRFDKHAEKRYLDRVNTPSVTTGVVRISSQSPHRKRQK